MSRHSTAVVLGGGGLAGIGWTTGVLAALEEQGVLRLGSADCVIGTSAGAAVAAAVLQSGSAGAEFDRIVRKSRRGDELAPAAALADVLPEVLAIHASEDSMATKTERFTQLSQQRAGIDPALRRAAVAGRVRSDSWPSDRLHITSVRTDGSRTVFTSASGVALVDALTASCAVPGLWPVARIGGKEYIDGGTFSLTNAELARTADHVIVLRPTPELPQYLTEERRETLEHATLIEPSERARAGFGPDPFDPHVRGIAAILGYEDGLAAMPAWLRR
ncbi:patatin-like phospholipase family protein [Streptomyces sp. CBMA152]|uniref:patatin-like phospholipase family protein n=1 Tax=Streptomyces sp. CBMA152 TaxID=1896312 RepID=UPI001660B652|nr:patatin-like phospholipase family protein [Streptomyces sp. CBMA152]MBD0741512.1 patatin [Streptomyces sp. CBMA152]